MHRGSAVYTKGKFTVFEIVELDLDDNREIVGYQLVGPDAESTWLYDLRSAISAADYLETKRKLSSTVRLR